MTRKTNSVKFALRPFHEVNKISNEADKSNMRKTILEFPGQFRAGLESAKKIKRAGHFDALTVCGMGGSALPGDILNIWLSAYRIALPLYVSRDYELPLQTDQNHLVVCLSYSGNTEETIEAFGLALKKNIKIAVVASGGKLTELCKKKNIPAALIPAGYQPRMAAGFQFAALMKILANSGIIRNESEKVLNLEKSLKPEILENQGKKLAEKMAGKIPLIYSSSGRLAPLARIWKIKFNENAKTPAFHNYFPELNHNEMTGFSGIANSCFHVLILRDPADHPRNLKRISLTAEILKKKGIKVDIIEITGKNILHKTFSNMILADWVSYYLALKYKVDPTPVKIIEGFKKRLAS